VKFVHVFPSFVRRGRGGRSMGRNQRRALILSLFLLLLASPGWAGPCEDPTIDGDSGPVEQVAAGALGMPYTAVKGLVALVGGIVSIPLYILSLGNENLTRAVWLPAVSGTFILTPAHLTGRQPIRFLPKCPEG
jgi:hypothetical protein